MKASSAAFVLLMATWLPATAQDRQALYARALAANCAACHGTDGRAVAGSEIVSLAGMPRDQLAASLKAFKSAARPATVMQQLAKGYSDAQIEVLAAYFSAQSR